jgi:hypothetical protein
VSDPLAPISWPEGRRFAFTVFDDSECVVRVK